MKSLASFVEILFKISTYQTASLSTAVRALNIALLTLLRYVKLPLLGVISLNVSQL